MPEQRGVDRVASLVEGHAETFLGDLIRSGDVPRQGVAALSREGWTVVLLATPTPPAAGLPGLTECDRDCVLLLLRSREPLSGARACKELDRLGIGVHGESTVKRSLARLKRLGLARNSRRSPRGYSFADAGPLFRRPPPP
jgi:hypothetical protein